MVDDTHPLYINITSNNCAIFYCSRFFQASLKGRCIIMSGSLRKILIHPLGLHLMSTAATHVSYSVVTLFPNEFASHLEHFT